MAESTVWLFSIQGHNWDECVAGPPNLEVHGEHVGEPWHGLSSRSAGIADNMQPGETALVRQSGSGVMGVWEIVDTAPVQSQRHHNWEEEYARFIYCRALDREFPPFDDTQYFEGTDYVRFKQGANALNDDDARTFISNLLRDMGDEISTEARNRLESELAEIDASASVEVPVDKSTDAEQDGIGVSVPNNHINTSGTVRERTGETVTISETFRQETLDRYQNRCLLTDIEGSPFVTVAHILPRSEEMEEAENPENVVVLNWLHHQAFDAEIFTLDLDSRLHINPKFSTQSEFLQQTLVQRDGERIKLPPNASIDERFLARRNADIDWL